MNIEFTFTTQDRDFSAEPERVNYNGTDGHFWTFREITDSGRIHHAKVFRPMRTTKAQLIEALEYYL